MRQRLLVAHRPAGPRPAGPRAGGSPAPPCADPDRARDGSVLRRALAAATGLCAGGIGTAGQPAPSSGPLGTGSPRLGRVSGFRTAAFGIPHSAAPRVARHGAGSIGRAALVLAAGLCAGSQCAANPASEPPARVVSINLCTDQLALMLAAPGQLVSVGNLAQDPRSSPMAEAARRLPGNAARAEEIYLMRPDLVLAGRFSSRATVAMLRRLGVKVVEFDPAYSLADIADRIAGIGRALGREDAAARMIAAFEADLAALQAEAADRPRAALYYANGYTGGERSLAGEIVVAAGFANIAAELGMIRGGRVALERLILAAPDLVVTGQRHPGASRAEAILDHPALAGIGAGRGAMTDRDWVCGTPHVLAAIRDMARLRADLRPDPDTDPRTDQRTGPGGTPRDGRDTRAAPGYDPAQPTGEPQ